MSSLASQTLFNLLGYPGLPLLFGVHLNLFTAPIMLALLISAVGCVLLTLCFDGRMPVGSHTKEEDIKEKSTEAIKQRKFMLSLFCEHCLLSINQRRFAAGTGEASEAADEHVRLGCSFGMLLHEDHHRIDDT